MASKFSAFLTISRANIQVATIPHALIGISLAANDIEDILTIFTLLYVFLCILLITFASNINCLYDRDVDRHYKIHLYEATELLGLQTVKYILAVEMIVALIITLFFYINGYFITSILSLLGIGIGIIYSAIPPRVKACGIFSPFPVLFGLYMLPILGGWFLIKDVVNFYFIIFLIGYAFMNEGFVLINTCEDYAEDKIEGISTWAHVFGLRRTLHISFAFALTGILCLPIIVKKALPFVDIWSMASLLFTILFIIFLVVSARDIYNASKGDVEKSVKIYAKKMPIWFMSTRYPLFLSIFLTLF